jgi:hypothetical protein
MFGIFQSNRIGLTSFFFVRSESVAFIRDIIIQQNSFIFFCNFTKKCVTYKQTICISEFLIGKKIGFYSEHISIVPYHR